MLKGRAEELELERQQLEARREPEQLALEGRRRAAAEAEQARDEAAALATAASDEYARAQQAIEGVEQDVEGARADVYAVLNTITALNAALESASSQRERAIGAEGRLELEARELAAELGKAQAQRQAAAEALRRAVDGLDAAKVARAARESELASARIEHEWRSRDVRSREHDLAAMTARLHSLEEIDTHRSGFADAARLVLVNANGKVGQMGALADFIEVEPKYERAVEACMGDLLQHVLVERLEHVSAGLQLIRQEDAGRCGFVVGKPSEGTEFTRRFLTEGSDEAAGFFTIGFFTGVRRGFLSGGGHTAVHCAGGTVAALVGGSRWRAVSAGRAGGDGRGAHRRVVRDRRADCADGAVSGGHPRRRRLPRAPCRDRR